MQNKLKALFLSLFTNKKFYHIISLIISALIIYYSYEYHIEKILTDINLIERNIKLLKNNKLDKKIEKLKIENQELNKEYKELLKISKKNMNLLYKDKYKVVVDVINKLNSASFNIYKYNLNDSYDEMDLEINGSYLNLIKFFDFLQTIKADVTLNTYTIGLEEDKMLIKLKIKIGIIKI